MKKPPRVHLPPMQNLQPKPVPSAEDVHRMLERHPEVQKIRARRFSDWLTTPLDGGSWTAWGMKAKPDQLGMTYMAINKVSPAPEPPDVGVARWTHTRYVKTHSAMPKEVVSRFAPKYGGSRELDRKYQVWIEGAAELAEEALAHQWRPSRTLRWEEMKPLSPDLERAFDQLLTYLIQCEYFCSDAMGPWIGLVHYAFVEIKSYLAYELFDYNLACGTLRKRVLSNGGGMGVQVEGFDAGVLEVCNEASKGFVGEVERDFNAMVFAIDVFFNNLLVQVLTLGAEGARSPFDRGLREQMARDNSRHVKWGVNRIKYYLEHCPDREDAAIKLNLVADQVELAQTEHHLLNPLLIEPLGVLLGGGPDRLEEGLARIRAFWPQFASSYLDLLDSLGLPRRDRCLLPRQAPF